MKAKYHALAGVCVLAAALSAIDDRNAYAQDSIQRLPDIYVSASRLGGGIIGTSTTIVSAEDIQRAPQQSLQDILSREAGIQTQSIYGGVNGAGSLVDMRGFGVTAPSNTLILINGRRMNDWDIPGFDLSTIDRNSIERIEITRGNSGAVLYGDGAVGGVINIVTKTGVNQPPSARIQGTFGSFNQREGNASFNASSGPFAAAISGNVISTDGYRANNELRQQSGVGDFRYTGPQGTAFLTVTGDNQHLGLPGQRDVNPFVNQMATDRRGTNNPFDYGDKQTANMTTGFTQMLSPSTELIVDGGIRVKGQQAAFISSGSYVDTRVNVFSATPRLKIDETLFGLPTKVITGIDVYRTDYSSDRSVAKGAAPNHVYDLGQTTMAGYWQQTVSVRPDTDVAAGYRAEWISVMARDRFDPTAPASPFGVNPQGLPLDKDEMQQAWHVGIEHRLTSNLTLFGRAAQSFRVPNADERVGMSPILTVTNFNLKTQRSRDVEGGIRARFGAFELQSSVYDMELTNELHFSPITFANTNLDPTRRYGVENTVRYQAMDDVLLKGSATYTRSIFRDGPFAGKDVPEVSRWTASAGLTWNIWQKQLVFDGVVRYVGKRFLDGDEANTGTMILPAYTVVDARIGGEVDQFFWSLSVQNLFNKLYTDYALDQGFGFFAFYPLPGRIVMAKAGVKF